MRTLSSFLILIFITGITFAQNTKHKIEFPKNEVVITNQIQPILNDVVNVLSLNKQLIVSLESKTTNNSDIQKERENNISNYLVEKGVDLYKIMIGLEIAPEQDNIIQVIITESSEEILVASNQKTEAENTESTSNSTSPQSTTAVNTGDVVITNIFFDFNKDNTSEYHSNLDKLANYLKNNSTAKIEIQGYTDLQGEADYNLQLSQKRADFAKNYLVKKGCDKNNILAKGFGEEKQISSDIGPEYRKYNRRVEFIVLKQGQNKLIVEAINIPKESTAVNNTKKSSKTSNNKNVVFSIQLKSSKKQFKRDEYEKEFKEYKNDITEYPGQGSYYKYAFGSFSTYKKAEAELEKVKTIFNDAFIVNPNKHYNK